MIERFYMGVERLVMFAFALLALVFGVMVVGGLGVGAVVLLLSAL